ncbi:hypothetical protein BT96DRAFT_948092 [Gymnopus androsaceus JB14]|uniref:Secreted protein n=1 Tax=Gymnopus androsaceus JB14 TaxID=1447944 RepID=A0A6A4GQ25_9AGAR|nr:hypothetical protein BT96DRAFT_948092 [Gymnopus androsaceus JB14]
MLTFRQLTLTLRWPPLTLARLTLTNSWLIPTSADLKVTYNTGAIEVSQHLPIRTKGGTGVIAEPCRSHIHIMSRRLPNQSSQCQNVVIQQLFKVVPEFGTVSNHASGSGTSVTVMNE